MTTDDRATMRIQLRAGAKDRLESLCRDRGMTQIAVMSRLVDWFVEQDDLIQGLVLRHFNVADESELGQILIDRMIEQSRRGRP